MYILTIGRAYPEKKTGMIGIFEYEQAKALSNTGNKVVYGFCDNRSLKVFRKFGKFRKTQDNVEIYGRFLPVGGLPEKLHGKFKTAEFKKLMELIISEQGKPDVIHIHFPLLTITSEIYDYLRTLGCRIVITEHWSKVLKKEISLYRKQLLCKLADNADEFICVSSLLKKSVCELTNTKKEIYVVPNMVSGDFTYAEKKNNSDIFSFIAVGRLVELKRFDIDIEGFTKAFKGNKNVKLKIVGDGVLRSSLESQIKNLGMQDQIELLGFKNHDEVAGIVADCDCHVSSSVLETFGVPFVEGWVTGLPSIGVKNGPIDEYFNESNGVLFDADNSDALAEAMKQVYNNRDKYDRKAISEWAVSMFSSRCVADRLVEIFSE
ncbi:MAG: glycosyltransferase [Ruminococcus sp.]|nr:glycosyltransferase [Ruminococcus sp.]